MNRSFLIASTITVLLVATSYWLGYIKIELETLIAATGLLIVGLYLLFRMSLQPKAFLTIKDVHFEEKIINGVKGHQLRAKIVGKGARKISNLEASFEIIPLGNVALKLLDVVVSVDEAGKRKVDYEEASMRKLEYAWVTDDGKKVKGPWKELRKGERVGLIYPHQTFWLYVGKRGVESHTLLKLREKAEYLVTIKVRGEDSNGNIVEGRSKTTLKT